MENLNYDKSSHGRYHVFSFNEKYFIYDINQMAAYEVSEFLYTKLMGGDNDFFYSVVSSLPKPDFKGQHQNDDYRLGTLVLFVAQVCNLSCVYCYGVDGEYGKRGVMTEEIACKSVDFLIKSSGDLRNLNISFFGGEPLLNFTVIRKVVDYAKITAKQNDKTITFTLTTNGTKFSDEVNDYLNENNFAVTVSFDGDESVQNLNRPFKNGEGSYDFIKPKIEKFLFSRQGNAYVRATVTNHSVDISQLRNKLKMLGFRNVSTSIATLSQYALQNRVVDKLSKFQKHDVLSGIDVEAGNLLFTIKNRCDLAEFSDSDVLSFLKQLKHRDKAYYPCKAGRTLFGVSILGDVYPCHRFVGEESFKLGNIDNFNNDSRRDYFDSFTESHPICSKCWAKYHCGGGGCIHDNKETNGDVRKININHCTVLKHKVKNSIFLFSLLDESDKEYLFRFKNEEDVCSK